MKLRLIGRALALSLAFGAAAHAEDTLKIGIIAPMTGPGAPWGMAIAEGVLNVLYVDPSNEAYKRFAAAYQAAVGQIPNESMAPYTDGVNVLIQAIRKSGAIDDTSRFEEGFKAAFPMRSMQGETLTYGGAEVYGVDHQVNAVRYIGRIEDGAPGVVGKIQ